MTPDKSGTPTEQLLYLIGWVAKGADPRKWCESCHHYWLDFRKSRMGTPGCGQFDVVTLLRATCREWEKKGRV